MNEQQFNDEAQASFPLLPSPPLQKMILSDLAKILTGAVAGAVGLWVMSGAKSLHTAIGAVVGALVGGLFTRQPLREWVIFRGPVAGIFLSYPDMGPVLHNSFVAVTKVATCMAIGLVIIGHLR